MPQKPLSLRVIPDAQHDKVVWFFQLFYRVWKRFLLIGNVSLIVDLITQKQGQVPDIAEKMEATFATGLAPVGYQQNHLTLNGATPILAKAATEHTTSSGGQ